MYGKVKLEAMQKDEKESMASVTISEEEMEPPELTDSEEDFVQWISRVLLEN